MERAAPRRHHPDRRHRGPAQGDDGRDRTLTGRDHTFVMGSSMGGLISAYAMCEYPEVFGGAGCVSTHWPADDHSEHAWRRRVHVPLTFLLGDR